VVRLLAGTLGGEDSAKDDSFTDGLLEYPQYTRPPSFRGMKVPDILLSGDHAKIAKWRREQALERTKQSRPDLLEPNRE
ncbi:MAG: tRNA (guanosine(37)-N1)-methyltransferase TrmD, partial [Planctomycetota bacterium]